MTEGNAPSTPPAPTAARGQTLAIQPARGVPVPPRVSLPRSGGGYPRPYANERHNSRVETALPVGKWQLKWQVPLENELGATFVLQEGERILMAGTYQWILYGMDGKPLKKGPMGGGEAVFDVAHSLFYAPDPSDMIAAYRVNDGSTAFAVNGYPGNGYARTLIVRRGRLLLNVSPGAMARPHSTAVLSETGLQVIDLGEPQQVDESDILQNATVPARDSRPTMRVLAAMHADTLVLAYKDRVQFADLQLHVVTELTGEFDPQALSLDETGRVYLIVRAQNQRSLWVVTANGERVLAFDLPPADVSRPPIVGADHRVYVVEPGRVLAITPEGKLLWERALAGRVGGAVITADDRLLVAVGVQVVAFDAEGKGTVLYTFTEPLETPPVLTAHGELFVASQGTLYDLEARPPEPGE